MTQAVLRFGPFTLDPQAGRLAREGAPVAVNHRGLALLVALAATPDRAVAKGALMDAAWPGLAVEESNLSVQIAALRKILGPRPDGGAWIETVPRIGYRLAGPGGEAESGAPQPEPPVRPGIAVLPFAILGEAGNEEYLADGLTDDIITALARFRWFFVAARSSSFAQKGRPVDARRIAEDLGVRYLLEGSLRRAGHRIRISAHLVDAAAGAHVWAERYDLEMADIFAVQDDLAERVVGAIEPELLRSEAVAHPERHTGNISAWDLVRQGTWSFHQVAQASHLRARDLFRQACALDPDLPEAQIWRARVNAGLIAYGWSDDPASDRREALDAALRAVALDARNPYAQYALTIASLYGDAPAQGLRAAGRAIALSPGFALGHLGLGMARLFEGNAPGAAEALAQGLRLNPHDPQNAVFYAMLALAQLFADAPEAALASAERAVEVRPDRRTAYMFLACVQSALGQREAAARSLDRMEKLEPSHGDALGPLRAHRPEWAARIEALLREARGG
jgi:TolB-like protein